jgi:ferrochelatase
MNPNRETTVLLVNLGSPNAPTPWEVMRFLRQFLGDKRVVEIPSLLWKGILYGLVLPIRSKKTAKLYQKIWTTSGSPLTVNTQKLTLRLKEKLSQILECPPNILYAMTYGFPNLSTVLKENLSEDTKKLIVIPLFPFYSATTTASIWDRLTQHFKNKRRLPSIHFINEYGAEPLFREGILKSIQDYWDANGTPERLLFSFHGLPKRNVRLKDPYVESCLEMGTSLRNMLKFPEKNIDFSFQSRFGYSEWVGPNTIDVVTKWAQSGIESVDVICPSFAVDCLETLEEIAIQTKEKFLFAGGKKLRYIPALNDHFYQINVLTDLILKFF